MGRKETYSRSRDAASFVRNLDGQILFALHDHDFDGRKVVFVFHAVPFNDGSERILQKLKANMTPVGVSS
jgi:hypothetical protein